MFIICYGDVKTGSTLCFNLVTELLEYCGHPQANIPAGAASPVGINFVQGKLAKTKAWAEVLDSHSRIERYFAIKTHATCTPEVKALVHAGKVKVIANTRDPRDVFLSMQDAGKKNKVGAFSNLTTPQACLNSMLKNAGKLLGWAVTGSSVYDYHEIAFDSISFLKAISKYLKLPAIDESACKLIVDNVRLKGIGTFNLGMPHRFLTNMSAGQALYYTHLFQDRIRLLTQLNQRTGTSARGFYPLVSECKKTSQTKSITKKTFVVLGCPRGGTSLIAGALAISGVAMGRFGTGQYEDPDFKMEYMAATDENIEAKLFSYIQQRNESHEFWGWKHPNSIHYIDKIRHLLINPVFIFIYRDPEAIARSSAKHDKKSWESHEQALLSVAKNHTNKVKDFERRVGGNAVSFELEDIKNHVAGFIDRISSIVSPLEADPRVLTQFIKRDGGYNRVADLPGYTDRHYGAQVWHQTTREISRLNKAKREELSEFIYPKRAENWALVETFGQYQLKNESTDQLLDCNASAILILDYCNGKHSIRDIEKLIRQLLPDTPKNLGDEIYEIINKFIAKQVVVDWGEQ